MSIIEIRMPEEANEGTVASVGQWLSKLGDAVEEHQPLIEINTDKVTIEVPSPASGKLIEILKSAGDTVHPGDLLGRIDIAARNQGTNEPVAAKTAAAGAAYVSAASDGEATYSPAVRRMLKQHGLDPQRIHKLGRGGRLTIEDVEAFLAGAPAQSQSSPARGIAGCSTNAGRRIAHTPMRKSIANHMARSVLAAPHVTAVFEADLSHVLADRVRRKTADADAVPSVTAYLIYAAVRAMRVVPEVNSRWHDEYLEVFDSVHFGVGTALETGGLVVPVIQDAHRMDLLSLSKTLKALTAKARSGKLTQAEMSGGTFTLSNHGVSGSLLAAPIIIPHGQSAILGAGKMQKRVIVCETGGRELFRVRPMMYVTLTVDHRVLDGQQANGFMTAFVAALESPREASA